MADWNEVRHDPSYPEPLDPEIVPLCDALNAAGFVTTSSCCGHGRGWPYVWFEDGDGARIDRLARHVIARLDARGENRPHFAMFQRETLPDGYAWCVELHLNNVYADTPTADGLAAAVVAINEVAALVQEFAREEATARRARLGKPPGPVPPPRPSGVDYEVA